VTTIHEPAPAAFRGPLVSPGDAGYDEARKLYNGMIDKRPALIARCTDEADVISAVNYARETGMPLAIRGGGHNGAGLGSVDDGVMIDLGSMRGIRVDAEDGTVLAQGGCTFGDLDHATHAFGMAVPGGVVSTTGIGGLTLGGGIGHLSRKYGLSIDSMLEADVVLADGREVKASESENADLFWALRGGGGNFGVVTMFKYRLNPVHTVTAGPVFWPLEMAPEVMRFWDEFMRDAPEDLNGFFAFVTVPPVDPFPKELWDQKVCGVVWCHVGSAEEADEVLAPVREFGPPAMYGVDRMPFPAIQSAFDDLYPTGDQWYWRADFVNELSDEAIQRHVAHAALMPSMQSTMHLYPIDGAVHRKAPGDTAFAYRDARWAQVMAGVDPDPANAEKLRDWTVSYWEDLHPYCAPGAYVNFMMEEGEERVRATYRENYDRLTEVKAKYDPGNLFRVNQNIKPAQA
jgi:FAD/FMN-containing dehydrogenase